MLDGVNAEHRTPPGRRRRLCVSHEAYPALPSFKTCVRGLGSCRHAVRPARENLKWLWNGSGMNRTRRTKRSVQGLSAEATVIAVCIVGREFRWILLLASSECYYLVVRRQMRIVMRLNEVHHTNLALRLKGCFRAFYAILNCPPSMGRNAIIFIFGLMVQKPDRLITETDQS